MQTTTQNAAHGAAMAQPCHQERDDLRLVREAQDIADRLSETLCAGESIAELVSLCDASHTFSMRDFAALGAMHSDAVEAQVDALDKVLTAISAAQRPCPPATPARQWMSEAHENLYHLSRCKGALRVFANMAAYTKDALGEELGDAIHVMTSAAQQHLASLETTLGALSAALPGDASNEPTGGAA